MTSRRRARTQMVLRNLEPLASVVAVLAVWEVVSRTGLVYERSLPPPSTIASALATDVDDVRAFGREQFRACNFGGDIVVDAVSRERIRRDVENSHHEGAPAELEAMPLDLDRHRRIAMFGIVGFRQSRQWRNGEAPSHGPCGGGWRDRRISSRARF